MESTKLDFHRLNRSSRPFGWNIKTLLSISNLVRFNFVLNYRVIKSLCAPDDYGTKKHVKIF
jgi:hypothetical protein